MRIYVIRHGLTDMNKRAVINAEIDEPLAPEGEEQAKQAAKTLPKTITHVYASSQKRARQTAQHLVAPTGLPISTHDELVEIKLGDLAGMAWTEMPDGEKLKTQHRTAVFDYTPHGGESNEQVTKRLKDFVTEIDAKQHQDDEVLVVTHGGIMRMLRFLEDEETIYDTQDNLAMVVFDTDKILNR
jgi:broad specificity phosphatase PhoE